MANIDIAQIKSILTAAKKARGSASRIAGSGQQEPSTAARGIKELLPILEKAGLDVTAVKKTLKEDRAGDDRKPTADAVKRHAWSKKTLVKNMKARAGARRTAVPADSPFNQPTVIEYIQPFYIWPQPAGILTQSNLAADDNWASVWLELTDATSGGGYVSFLYLWTNTNNFAVGIDVDTSLAFIGYLKATAGAIGGIQWRARSGDHGHLSNGR